MNRIVTSLIGASAALIFGCSSHYSKPEVTNLPSTQTFTLVIQDLTLSPTNPTAQLGQYSIRLLSIADDGATQTRVVETDNLLSAHPGQCFVSYEFGQEGLQLLSASKSSGVASMTSRGVVSW
jgi:hypothetical protein